MVATLVQVFPRSDSTTRQNPPFCNNPLKYQANSLSEPDHVDAIQWAGAFGGIFTVQIRRLCESCSHGDMETSRQGYKERRGQGDKDIRREGDKETRI